MRVISCCKVEASCVMQSVSRNRILQTLFLFLPYIQMKLISIPRVVIEVDFKEQSTVKKSNSVSNGRSIQQVFQRKKRANSCCYIYHKAKYFFRSTIQ